MDALRLSRVEQIAGVCDEAELARAASSDPAAFAMIYERHSDDVFRYLRSRCLGPDDALELTAVTFERAFVAIERYRPVGAGLRAWLIRIARNAAIDQERRDRRTRPIDDADHEQASASPSPEDVAVLADERRAVHLLVQALPDPQRDAIAMRFGAGMTAREIGQVLGKSDDATQKLITRALARLREVYRHDD